MHFTNSLKVLLAVKSNHKKQPAKASAAAPTVARPSDSYDSQSKLNPLSFNGRDNGNPGLRSPV
jgi:hypothetical protein